MIPLSLETEFIFDLLNTSDWPGASVPMLFKKNADLLTQMRIILLLT